MNKFIVEYFGHSGDVLGIKEFEAENIETAKMIIENEIAEKTFIYINSVEKEKLGIGFVGIRTSAILKFYLG